MINLFINSYLSSSEDRNKELNEVLNINLQSCVKIYSVVESYIDYL